MIQILKCVQLNDLINEFGNNKKAYLHLFTDTYLCGDEGVLDSVPSSRIIDYVMHPDVTKNITNIDNAAKYLKNNNIDYVIND